MNARLVHVEIVDGRPVKRRSHRRVFRVALHLYTQEPSPRHGTGLDLGDEPAQCAGAMIRRNKPAQKSAQ